MENISGAINLLVCGIGYLSWLLVQLVEVQDSRENNGSY